jgi:hypothetical protein
LTKSSYAILSFERWEKISFVAFWVWNNIKAALLGFYATCGGVVPSISSYFGSFIYKTCIFIGSIVFSYLLSCNIVSKPYLICLQVIWPSILAMTTQSGTYFGSSPIDDFYLKLNYRTSYRNNCEILTIH